MALDLIRHTRPRIADGICYGSLDLDVDDTFFSEAEAVREKLSLSYSGVFVSPMRRCVKLADYLDLPYQVDERLREMSFGTWEGVSWSEIDQEEIDSWANDISGYQVPEGERFQDVIERVDAFLSELPEGKHLLITHAGIIKACWILRGGFSLDRAASQTIAFGDCLSIP